MTGGTLDAERAPAALAAQGVAGNADSRPAPLVDAGTLLAWLCERAARPGPLVVQAIYDGLRTRVDRGDFSGSQLETGGRRTGEVGPSVRWSS